MKKYLFNFSLLKKYSFFWVQQGQIRIFSKIHGIPMVLGDKVSQKKQKRNISVKVIFFLC